MKNNRKFLVPLAALTSIFATGHASANAQNQTAGTESTITEPMNVTTSDTVITGSHDLFKFVLRRNGEGVMVADHESHYSHESHASHASHSSHYSGY